MCSSALPGVWSFLRVTHRQHPQQLRHEEPPSQGACRDEEMVVDDACMASLNGWPRWEGRGAALLFGTQISRK